MGITGSKFHPAYRTFMLDAVHEHGGSINCMTLSEDSSVLVTGSEDRSVRIWTTRTKRCECIGILTGHENYISCVAVEGVDVFSGSADNTIRKWDMSTCLCLLIFRGHKGRINRILTIGEFIFSSSVDRTIRCWDADNAACIREFIGHTNGVFPIVFVPVIDPENEDELEVPPQIENTRNEEEGKEKDGMVERKKRYHYKDMIVSGSSDSTARSWSFETGRTLEVFKGHAGPITKVATDVDNKFLFTCSTDATVRCWHLKSGKMLKVFDQHTGAIVCMTVVNRVIYTGSVDHTARAYFLDRKTEDTVTFSGHGHTIMCIKYHDGMVLTGNAEGTVYCHDARTGEVLRIFRGPPTSVVNAMQIVDNRLFTGSTDGTLRNWTLRGMKKNDGYADDSMDDFGPQM